MCMLSELELWKEVTKVLIPVLIVFLCRSIWDFYATKRKEANARAVIDSINRITFEALEHPQKHTHGNYHHVIETLRQMSEIVVRDGSRETQAAFIRYQSQIYRLDWLMNGNVTDVVPAYDKQREIINKAFEDTQKI